MNTDWREPPDSDVLALDALGPLNPIEVLYAFELPLIFTTRMPSGIQLLAYFCEESEDGQNLRYLLATTSDATIDGLKDGSLSVRDALLRGTLFVVDLDNRLVPLRAFATRHENLPSDALPAATTMLRADLEPHFSVCLEGPELGDAGIPTAALTFIGNVAAKAFKPIYEWIAQGLTGDTGGRPPESLRSHYALPLQRLARGSVIAAFRIDTRVLNPGTSSSSAPDAEPSEAFQLKAMTALREGLIRLVADKLPSAAETDERWLAITETLARLTPPLSGPIHTVTLGGQGLEQLGTPALKLDRDIARRLRTWRTGLAPQHRTTTRIFDGLIRELDLDELTFTIRAQSEPKDIKCELDDDSFLEDVRNAHYFELNVSIVATSRNERTWTLIKLDFAQPAEPPVGT